MSLRRALTVAELTALIRGVISRSPDLEDVLVEGEISNLSMPASGHLYFTLKDAGASLSCVVWRSQRAEIPFRPDNGMTVIVHGRIEVYDAQGRYQLYADRLEPSGIGALALAVEQRRRALAAEGLFDESRKRSLPLLPRRVVVVTSRSGAALRDVVTVMRRRAPSVDLVLSPATVQGEGAVETLVLALERAQGVRGAEVVLLVRGGGSLEDLMAFNDERLARAIRGGRLPVVAGVGHETDTTIADLAADRRAPTPSAAAELVAPDCRRLAAELEARRAHLGAAARQEIGVKRGSLERHRLRLENASPIRRLPSHRQELDLRAERLRSGLLAAVTAKRRRLDAATAQLRVASPRQRVAVERQRLDGDVQRLSRLVAATLEQRRQQVGARARSARGALAAQGAGARLLDHHGRCQRGSAHRPGAVSPGSRLRTRLARGLVVSTVDAPGSTDRERTDVRYRPRHCGERMRGDDSEAPGAPGTGSDDIDSLSYERALAELDQIIERLERGAVALDEAIAAYERGARLARHCGELLDRTEQKISQLVVGAGGRVTEKPLEPGRETADPPMAPAGAPLVPIPGRLRELDVDPDEIPF